MAAYSSHYSKEKLNMFLLLGDPVIEEMNWTNPDYPGPVKDSTYLTSPAPLADTWMDSRTVSVDTEETLT